MVAGSIATKLSTMVSPADPVVVLGTGPRFVSRGGEKLDAALDRFGLDVAGLRALDAGSSTGGFVDCLLQRGAIEVIALDVGHGQMDGHLRMDPRVVLHEGHNIRSVDIELLGPAGPVDILTADLSFISLRTVARPLADLVRPGGDMVVLVKPQFEVGREQVGKRGIVRNAALQTAAVEKVRQTLLGLGCGRTEVIESPILGAEGNREFLLYGTD